MVIAFGGNAISPSDAEGNIEQQFAATRRTAVLLADLVAAGHSMVITHGNGPQVGNVMRRVELAASEVYTLPLETCVADTQGGMGYMIAQCLMNELGRRDMPRTVTTIITTVEVDRDDPALTNPTKPIGRYYQRTQAEEMMGRYGWRMTEIAGLGFRRIVPSPIPQRIVEIDLIRRLASDGELLIAGGGGGIPVTRNADGDLIGVEAVIDKDYTSGIIASEIGATEFVVATGVERVAVDFGGPNERFLDRMTIAEARGHLSDGQFPPGSMGPKIEAAIRFLESAESADARVLICALDSIGQALNGTGGTWICRD